jgi:DNA repair protein RadC
MTIKPRLPRLEYFESEPLSASKLRDEPDWSLVERITGRKCPETVNLRTLSRMTQTELGKTLGLTDGQTKKLSAALVLGERLAYAGIERGEFIRKGEDVFRIFQGRMKDAKKEGFYAISMDQKHKVIDIHRISEGTLSMCPVHPREAFNPIIRDSAAAVIFLHNHPSGDPSPSQDDHSLTVRLEEAGKLLGIRVLDHIVVGEETFVSFRDRGLLGDEAEKASRAAEGYGCREDPDSPGDRGKSVRTFLVDHREKVEGGHAPDYTGLVVIGKTPHKVDLWKDGQIQIARRGSDRFTAVGSGRLVPSGPGELTGTIPVQTDRNVRTSVELGIRGVGEGTPVRLSVKERRIEKTLDRTSPPERGISR